MNFEYAAAPESRSVLKIDPEYGHFINGKWVNGSTHFNTINPATEEVLSRISLGTAADVDAAAAGVTAGIEAGCGEFEVAAEDLEAAAGLASTPARRIERAGDPNRSGIALQDDLAVDIAH